MQSWKIITVAAAAVIIGAVITATALAYSSGQPFFGTPYGNPNSNPNYGSQPWGMGMMGGGMGGMMGGGYIPQNTVPPQTGQGQWGSGNWGWGCHGQWGNQPNYFNGTLTTPMTINQATTIAQQYLQSLNNADLAIAEVEEYTLNFYVEYYEKSTGIGAFEMLIDKYGGRISPEMGPNMMWNTRYGMMGGGMMGGFIGRTTGPMSVTVEQAGALAQQYLNTNLLGTSVGEVMPFYGYYHVHVLSAGKTYGMLSVNGYTGQVWYHTWHGVFIQELEL